MKYIIALAAIALLGTGALAKDRCNPATGNWINAAKITCPEQGSGPQERKPVCESKG